MCGAISFFERLPMLPSSGALTEYLQKTAPDRVDAAFVAYLAALSWFQGLVGGSDWLPTLAAQLLTVSDAVLGPLPVTEPLTLVWLLFERAPWIALLPLAWLLWERDRASSSQAA